MTFDEVMEDVRETPVIELIELAAATYMVLEELRVTYKVGTDEENVPPVLDQYLSRVEELADLYRERIGSSI